jgi:hypothetical protein
VPDDGATDFDASDPTGAESGAFAVTVGASGAFNAGVAGGFNVSTSMPDADFLSAAADGVSGFGSVVAVALALPPVVIAVSLALVPDSPKPGAAIGGAAGIAAVPDGVADGSGVGVGVSLDAGSLDAGSLVPLGLAPSPAG